MYVSSCVHLEPGRRYGIHGIEVSGTCAMPGSLCRFWEPKPGPHCTENALKNRAIAPQL